MAANQPESLFTQLDKKIDAYKIKQKAKKMKIQQSNNSSNGSLF